MPPFTKYLCDFRSNMFSYAGRNIFIFISYFLRNSYWKFIFILIINIIFPCPFDDGMILFLNITKLLINGIPKLLIIILNISVIIKEFIKFT